MSLRRSLLTLAIVGLGARAAAAVEIEVVPIGAPGNEADSNGKGAVAEPFQMGTFEVTNAEYAEFLNAVAASDPNQLYDARMATDSVGGITRGGSSGSFVYTTKGGRDDKPVVYVSGFDALRFANWLHNGQPTEDQGVGTTEDGAYTFAGAPAVGPERNPEALFFVPDEDEWYKAAYYEASLDTYFNMPTGTDVDSSCERPDRDTGNSANCDRAVGDLTDVGAYAFSASPFGTFDQGGNVSEWTETITRPSPPARGVRGGNWTSSVILLHKGSSGQDNPQNFRGEDAQTGFRIATVPEPEIGLIVLAGILALSSAKAHRL